MYPYTKGDLCTWPQYHACTGSGLQRAKIHFTSVTNSSMATVPHRRLRSIMEPTGFSAAFKKGLNSLLCDGAAMLHLMYLYTTGDLCTWTQHYACTNSGSLQNIVEPTGLLDMS